MKFFVLCLGLMLSVNLFAASSTDGSEENHISTLCALNALEVALLLRTADTNSYQCSKPDEAMLQELNRKLLECVQTLTAKTSAHDIILVPDCSQKDTKDEEHFCQRIFTLHNFKTGCDWFIRTAGLIWALQTFYGLIV